MTILLDPNAKVNEGLPREYEMRLTNAHSTNMYVFSEEESQEPRRKRQQTQKNGAGGGGSGGGQAESGGAPQGLHRLAAADSRRQKYKRWQPHFRKSIASKVTSLSYPCTSLHFYAS